MPKIKRSQFRTFINTGTVETPVWALLGEGITDASISYNPDILEEHYIHEDSATKEVQAYAPEMTIEMSADVDDDAFVYLDGLRKSRAVLGAAESEIVNVWMYETPTLDAYPAERQTVSVSFEDFGGEGGTATGLSCTLSYIGDPIEGTFDAVTLAFTAT